jgi:hypothetical protein
MTMTISSGRDPQVPIDWRALGPSDRYWLPKGLTPSGCDGIESLRVASPASLIESLRAQVKNSSPVMLAVADGILADLL